ncbi:MAG: 1-deoxy-D-xylulose-5-phosphate synthase [Clostridia bacterium]|nr:1-deoxy-D-xylulose-5-phosphate synthase [Clostridia bacterium]
MELLSTIHGPDDVKKLSVDQCNALAKEIRQKIIDTVSRQGGHLASNLGNVELTIALHRAFNSPTDKLLFDVGHQTYTHKLLTGRQEMFDSLRSYQGMSGFPCHAESEHDLFDTGHSSTAISMGLGLAHARDLQHKDYHVVSVVGDGAMTGGMCYEAMNDAGDDRTRLIVVLNDNEMSISKNVGALSEYFKHLRASASWYGGKKHIKHHLLRIPLLGKPMAAMIEKAKDMIKSVVTEGELFEALGFRYLGPFDGHNIEEMTRVFEEAKQISDTPVLIHVITHKGHGYDLAERQPEKFHGVAPFRVENGLKRSQSSKESAAQVAGKALCALATQDERVVAITAAMAGGTGLSGFAEMYPDRFFDVGIAEQHAVSMAAGLARAGIRPYFAVYSTFLQRAYDQIVHDVCLQNLPVCILSDHVSLVGDDGKTHHGVLSVPMLLSIPNLTLLAPRDTDAIRASMGVALGVDGPCVIQYPKDGIEPYAEDMNGKPLEAGRWQWLRVSDSWDNCVVLAYGRMVKYALEAAKILHDQYGLHVGVIDAWSLRPMDMDCLHELFEEETRIVTIEEGEMIGGFGSEIARLCVEQGAPQPIAIMGLPNRFIAHGTVDQLLEECGLTVENIVQRIKDAMKKTERKDA